MKIAIVGSRNLIVDDLGDFLPDNVTEIVSGGARGIDACAKEYALANNIKLTEFLPDYEKYGKSAPLRRNLQIINYADKVLAFWDGKSRGTRFTIAACFEQNKKLDIFISENDFNDNFGK